MKAFDFNKCTSKLREILISNNFVQNNVQFLKINIVTPGNADSKFFLEAISLKSLNFECFYN